MRRTIAKAFGLDDATRLMLSLYLLWDFVMALGNYLINHEGHGEHEDGTKNSQKAPYPFSSLPPTVS